MTFAYIEIYCKSSRFDLYTCIEPSYCQLFGYDSIPYYERYQSRNMIIDWCIGKLLKLYE